MIAALEQAGVSRPADHIAMIRDFLGVCTMVPAPALEG